ncbi:MAG: hypothetical protein J6N76_05395, partial [Lachnospiraceae bacterium]|nr:hypothetical protein [Lachnospiraceae bacterium]
MIRSEVLFKATFYVVALAISLFTFILSLLEKRYKRKQTIAFNSLVVDVLASALSSVIFSVAVNYKPVSEEFTRMVFDVGQWG